MLTPNDLDKFFALDSCQQIRIQDYLREARNRLKEAIIDSQLAINGYKINLAKSKTHYGGIRLWFTCPECKNRKGVLYQSPLSIKTACRKCIGLIYRQQKQRHQQASIK